MVGQTFKTGRIGIGMKWSSSHLILVSGKAATFLENTMIGHHLKLCSFLSGKMKARDGRRNVRAKWGAHVKS